MLHNVINNWRNLALFCPNNKKGHYTTILKKFHTWTKAGIFKNVHANLLNKNVLSKYTTNTTLNCYIDATHINNVSGVDGINFSDNKKKKTTKLTAICNDNKKILDFIIAHRHDSKMVEPIVDAIKTKVKIRKINMVGDKGYKLNKDTLARLENKNIKMHVPQRKNQKIKTSIVTKTHLKQRYKIENVFQQLKTFSRIRTRYDKKSKNFKHFYISRS